MYRLRSRVSLPLLTAAALALVCPHSLAGSRCGPEAANRFALKGVRSSSRLKVNWGAWSAFIADADRQYQIRRKQHFSQVDKYPELTPTGREFYEQPWVLDGGTYLFQRYAAGDRNVTLLLKFGWRIDRSNPRVPRFLPPEDIREYYDSYFLGLHELFRDRAVRYTDLPVPALPFIRIRRTGSLVQDSIFLRPGLDPAPDPTEWRLALAYDDNVIDVPLETFSEIFSQNRPPLNPVMFDHDNAHLMDYLNNPTYYMANQNFYRRIAGSNPELHVSLDPNDQVGFALLGRSNVMHEEMCLPRQDRAPLVKLLVPHLFEEKSPTLDWNLQYARGKHPQNNIARALTLTERMNEIASRHGGGINDPYNLHNDLNVRTTPIGRLREHVRTRRLYIRFFGKEGREMFSQAALEGPMGLASDLKFVAGVLKRPNFKEFATKELGITNPVEVEQAREFLESFLNDRIARLEMALFAGIQQRITPGVFARETTEQFMNPDSQSYRYLSSWVAPGTQTYDLYLSPSVVRAGISVPNSR